MLCGVAPIPASSGKTNRHRLNRGGDRQANKALYRIVLCRLRWDPRTRAYAERRTKGSQMNNTLTSLFPWLIWWWPADVRRHREAAEAADRRRQRVHAGHGRAYQIHRRRRPKPHVVYLRALSGPSRKSVGG